VRASRECLMPVTDNVTALVSSDPRRGDSSLAALFSLATLTGASLLARRGGNRCLPFGGSIVVSPGPVACSGSPAAYQMCQASGVCKVAERQYGVAVSDGSRWSTHSRRGQRSRTSHATGQLEGALAANKKPPMHCLHSGALTLLTGLNSIPDLSRRIRIWAGASGVGRDRRRVPLPSDVGPKGSLTRTRLTKPRKKRFHVCGSSSLTLLMPEGCHVLQALCPTRWGGFPKCAGRSRSPVQEPCYTGEPGLRVHTATLSFRRRGARAFAAALFDQTFCRLLTHRAAAAFPRPTAAVAALAVLMPIDPYQHRGDASRRAVVERGTSVAWAVTRSLSSLLNTPSRFAQSRARQLKIFRGERYAVCRRQADNFCD
jgi:hypothetical protein